MTKEITRANILQEIQDKFRLRDLVPERFVFSETVLPIYDVGPHVKNWMIERYRYPVSVNGALTLVIPDEAEQWKIRRMALINETGGNFDVDQVIHYNLVDTASVDYIFYDTASPIANGIVKIFEFPQDIPFVPKDRLLVNISNFVAGGYVALHILKEVEVVR